MRFLLSLTPPGLALDPGVYDLCHQGRGRSVLDDHGRGRVSQAAQGGLRSRYQRETAALSLILTRQTFDTANVYSFGQSEIILGRFLKKYNIPRESVVILSKTFQPDFRDNKEWVPPPSGMVNLRGLNRKVGLASVNDVELVAHLCLGQGVSGEDATRLHGRPTVPPFRQ